jgi:hypothetical protein
MGVSLLKSYRSKYLAVPETDMSMMGARLARMSLCPEMWSLVPPVRWKCRGVAEVGVMNV